MRRIMILASCFLCLCLMVPNVLADTFVVCTQKVVVGVTRDGMKIFGNRCTGPTRWDSGHIPENCRWFHLPEQAYEWMNQNCDAQ